MTTKYDIGDKVVVKSLFLAGATRFNVKGIVKRIKINEFKSVEYDVQCFYPDGVVISGVDVSGMEVPCISLGIKEFEISFCDEKTKDNLK